MMRRPIDHAKREQEDRDHQDCGTLIMREKRQGEGTFLPPVPLESSDLSFNAGLDNPEAIAAVNAGGVIDCSHPLNLSRNTTEQSQDCEFRILDKIAPARQGLWKTLSLCASAEEPLRTRRAVAQYELRRSRLRTAFKPPRLLSTAPAFSFLRNFCL